MPNMLQNGTGSALPETRKSIVACYFSNARVETEANLAHLIGEGSFILPGRYVTDVVILKSFSHPVSQFRELDICLSFHEKK